MFSKLWARLSTFWKKITKYIVGGSVPAETDETDELDFTTEDNSYNSYIL